MKFRVGNGFDVHQLCSGKQIILCGLTIPNEKTLVGHSDADVALHALTDAILGALSKGDIGTYFPPTEKKWKGENSKTFLEKAMMLMQEDKFSIVNLDVTIICESPKIKDHSLEMRKNISRLCMIELDQVSIKGTTTEQLGFTGREEGIASIATVLLEKNE